ncbi:hypothetical protein BWI15_25955 [Kribbella sp. ALI-6-A]|nr:hypothetical protein BWI15_25955 [Kribbella sp. ALI-6-A]
MQRGPRLSLELDASPAAVHGEHRLCRQRVGALPTRHDRRTADAARHARGALPKQHGGALPKQHGRVHR